MAMIETQSNPKAKIAVRATFCMKHYVKPQGELVDYALFIFSDFYHISHPQLGFGHVHSYETDLKHKNQHLLRFSDVVVPIRKLDYPMKSNNKSRLIRKPQNQLYPKQQTSKQK